MNPKEVFDNTAYSVQLPYIAVTPFNSSKVLTSELGTLEWCISSLILDPLFFLISRLNYACSPIVIDLQIN